MKRLIAVLAFVLGLCGCACRIPVAGSTDHAAMSDLITLYGRPLEIRLSRPKDLQRQDFLVVYATGDGGWRSLDRELFDWIEAWGYPAVGFSSRNYLKNLGYVSDTETTTPRRLMRDLESVIAAARQKLDLPAETRVILVGLSRGAGLMVVAAGQRKLQPNLAGVIAVALTREEEHVIRHRRRRGEARDGMPTRERVEIKTYEYLRRLASFPVTVIQSTHDGYLPAEAARKLFGPDTELRKFHAVEARNHSFRGGRDTLRDKMEGSLRWTSDCSNHRTTQLLVSRNRQGGTGSRR